MIGGHTYKIKMGPAINAELRDCGLRGSHSDLWREIKLSTDKAPAEFSLIFEHELIHAINSIYLDGDLSEMQMSRISEGLLQVLVQLGIQFIK